MNERRNINRIDYVAKSVIVVCDTQEKFFVEVKNVSPLGMGIRMEKGSPNLVGKDIIIVAETLIMYADVVRQVEKPDGSFEVGIHARRFTDDILSYLFTHIG